MRRLLLTNDDGIDSPGLHALIAVFDKAQSVTVMAPSRNCSGASQSITLDRPIAVRPHPRGFAVDGTPCDCAHLALQGIPRHVQQQGMRQGSDAYDAVISGINKGSNLGEDVMYSGTVGAAREGNLAGVNSLAVSLACAANDDTLHWESAAWYAHLLWSHYSHATASTPYFFNVNVPNRPLLAIKGLTLTRLSTRAPSAGIVPTASPRGESSYWIGQFGEPMDDHSDGLMCDHMAVRDGWVSVTPLTRLSTSHDAPLQTDSIEALNRYIYLGAKS